MLIGRMLVFKIMGKKEIILRDKYMSGQDSTKIQR